MLFWDHLKGDHMFSFESCIDEDQIRSEILVQDVCVGWCSREDAKDISHALALH